MCFLAQKYQLAVVMISCCQDASQHVIILCSIFNILLKCNSHATFLFTSVMSPHFSISISVWTLLQRSNPRFNEVLKPFKSSHAGIPPNPDCSDAFLSFYRTIRSISPLQRWFGLFISDKKVEAEEGENANNIWVAAKRALSHIVLNKVLFIITHI